MSALYHFSEDPSIERFVPHVPVTNLQHAPAVWAIDAEHSPLYWFPRDCPRAAVWNVTGAVLGETGELVDRRGATTNPYRRAIVGATTAHNDCVSVRTSGRTVRSLARSGGPVHRDRNRRSQARRAVGGSRRVARGRGDSTAVRRQPVADHRLDRGQRTAVQHRAKTPRTVTPSATATSATTPYVTTMINSATRALPRRASSRGADATPGDAYSAGYSRRPLARRRSRSRPRRITSGLVRPSVGRDERSADVQLTVGSPHADRPRWAQRQTPATLVDEVMMAKTER